MNIETIKEILYNQAIDGEFSETNNAIKLIKAMTKTQQEVIMAAYLIERNNSLDVSLGERGMKSNKYNNQPNIQNLFPKTEDFKRIMEAVHKQKGLKKREDLNEG